MAISQGGLIAASDVNNHINNKNNPHAVTASQIGGLATVATTGSYNDLKDKPDSSSGVTLSVAQLSAMHPSTTGSTAILLDEITVWGIKAVAELSGSVSGSSSFPVVATLPTAVKGIAFLGAIKAGYTYSPIALAGEVKNIQYHPVDSYNSSCDYIRLAADGKSIKFYSDRGYKLDLSTIYALY